MDLGKSISEKRKSKGMTQEELASNLGVSPQAVSKWENNLSCPDITLLPEIAHIFNISVDELLNAEKKDAYTSHTPKTKEEPISEEAPASGKKITKLVMIREFNGKISTIKVPISVVRLGLNIGAVFGGLTNDQANSVEAAIKSGIVGEIVNIEGDNGEKMIISLA